jgi:hypothetical protein
MALIANHRSLPVWLSIAAALVLLLGSSVPAAACSCVDPGAPADAFAKADAVFTGTVREVTKDEARSLRDLPYYRGLNFTVDVNRVWKGKVLPREEMTSGGGCDGLPFRVGTKYLFYAARTPTDSNYYADLGICTRTVEYDARAANDLLYLVSLSSDRQALFAVAAIATLIAVLIIRQRRQHGAA